MKVLVIIPTYNEQENIEAIVRRVFEALPETGILIVDDGSPDGTGERADALARQHPDRLFVLHRKAKEGLGAAYVAGYRHALDTWPDLEYVFQMDADFSHDPAYLRPMLETARAGNDVVVGSRYVQGISIVNWPLHRLIVSQLGTAYARLMTGMPITDCTSGFKCYRATVLRDIGLERIRSNGYVFQVETSFRAWQQGFRLADFPIIFYERKHGESKLHLGIAFEACRIVARQGFERFRYGVRQSRPVIEPR